MTAPAAASTSAPTSASPHLSCAAFATLLCSAWWGNSAIMNIEPIFALVLAWAILGRSIAPSQVGGGLLVGGHGDLAGAAPAVSAGCVESQQTN